MSGFSPSFSQGFQASKNEKDQKQMFRRKNLFYTLSKV
jgi:hypothetical protein